MSSTGCFRCSRRDERRSGDAHSDDLHHRPGAGVDGSIVDLSGAEFVEVGPSDGSEVCRSPDRNRLGFDDFKSPVIYIIHHVVPGNVCEELFPSVGKSPRALLTTNIFKWHSIWDIELQGEL